MSFLLSLLLPLQLAVDVASFMGGDTISMSEVYITMPYSYLTYQKEGGKLKADFTILMKLLNPDRSVRMNDKWKRVAYITSREDARKRDLHLLDAISLSLSAGVYIMQISIVSGDKKNSIEKVIQVLPFSRESLSVSDIELATDIRKVKGETKFKRGGHQIIPNPERVFGGNRPILYLYSEIYNLKNNKKFTVAYSVLDSSGKLVVKYPEKVILAEKFNVPEIGGINVLGLKQGIYTLRIDVSQDDEKVEREKTFRVIKPVPRMEQFLFTKEEKKYYSFIDYIATRRQLNFFVTLDSVGKERFLQHFWKLKGRDCLLMYIDRIRYVDLHYKRKTDRGRIYIKYGKPDEINRYPSSSLYRACEKWLYYGEGGKEFIFVDIQGVGSYELIYSSDKEEFTDPNYRRFIPPSLWPG